MNRIRWVVPVSLLVAGCLGAEPPGPGAEASAGASAAGPADGGSYRAPALIGAGVGVVAAGIGGYLLVDAASQADASRVENDKGAYQNAKSQQTTGLVLTVGGGVVAAAGLAVFFLDPGGESAPTTAVAPSFAPGFAGISAAGRF